jgi:hypothetical protein
MLSFKRRIGSSRHFIQYIQEINYLQKKEWNNYKEQTNISCHAAFREAVVTEDDDLFCKDL